MKQDKEEPLKKSYKVPKFHFYGNIRELTQAVGNMGNSDNGKSPMHKSGT